jgi:hypothetical protein
VGTNSGVATDVSCCLSINVDTLTWLTGNNTGAIKPGAGIIDCAGSCGTAGQALLSNGANAVCWATPAATPAATPTVAGIVLGCTASSRTALGTSALLSNTTGTLNTAIGAFVLSCNTTGGGNTATGVCALRFNTVGCSNTADGIQALFNNTTGNFNTATGNAALYSNTAGSLNVAVGNSAGCLITTGCQNVAVGPNVQLVSATASCQLAIGFSATDNWLTGNSTKAIKPGAGIIDCANSCGALGQYMWTTGSNAIIWASSSPSDVRDKEVLGPVPTALPVVQQIEPITYRWKERESEVAQEEVIYGFSAQQLLEVDSVLVDNSDPDYLRIHDRKIVPLLVKAIQELSAQNKALEARIAQLEANG